MAFTRVVEYAKAHPWRMAAGAVAGAAASVALWRVLSKEEEPSVFVGAARSDDASQVAAAALLELGATGIFTAEEGAILSQDFLSLVKSRSRKNIDSDGEAQYTLDLPACEFIFARIGVTDTAVARSIFDQWDQDRTGHVDMKEFISVLVLVMRGRQSEKLAMIFNIMDLDHDGRISKPEMTRFLRTVDSLNGVKRTATARQAAVDAMFASVKTARLGFLSRDEFMALASQTRYHLGEQLAAFLDSLQRKFSTELTSEAASGTVGRAPPAPLPTPPTSGAGAVPMLLRTPSETTDEDAEYAQYKVAQTATAVKAEKPTPPTSPSLVASLE